MEQSVTPLARESRLWRTVAERFLREKENLSLPKASSGTPFLSHFRSIQTDRDRMRRLFVLELNEVPLRVLRWHADRNPDSATARLLSQSAVGQSVAAEPLPRDLYPSQSWASLSTGVPFSDHGVFWYGDPKLAEFPMYWQAAAQAGVSTGLVGVLHSSPLRTQCEAAAIRFAIPDSFAADSDTLPATLTSLQEFNLSMTRSNSRVVTNTSPVASYLRAMRALGRAGGSSTALLELARLALGVGTRRVPKERLRVGQFHLMADQFTRLAKRTDPRLTVLFSNHVASAMHRYWFTAFPDDWDEAIYDDVWVDKFSDELPYALRSLDRWLDQWMRWSEESNRTLLLLSSMGQTGGAKVDTSESEAIVVSDADRFARALGVHEPCEVGQAMVPQVTYHFRSTRTAQEVQARIASLLVSGRQLSADRSGAAVTVSYSALAGIGEKIEIEGRHMLLPEAGLAAHEVTEHRAGVHDPLGSILVFNSDTTEMPTEPIDYLSIAPAILNYLSVDALPHHCAPGLVL